MVGVISSMLNVFLLFLNSFLLCLFFLAGLIPQLLQKSQLFSEHGADDVAQQEQGDAGNIERRFNGETDG